MKFLYRKALDKVFSALGRNDELAVGFAHIGRELGEELVIGDAGGCREAGLGKTAGTDLGRRIGRRR